MSFNQNLLEDTFYDRALSKGKVDDLINYFESISGKQLSIKHIRNRLFKIRWKRQEYEMITSCHLKASAIYLDHLIKKNKVIDKQIIRTVIADISQFVEIADPSQNTSFILASTNILPSLIHYKQAESIFYDHKLPHSAINNYRNDLLVLYALRLSLEKRIHGLLSIDIVKNRNHPIGLASIIKIARRLKSIHYSPTINWDEIEMVNKWLNHHMHRHIRPFPWIIHQAFEVLNNILLPGKYKKSNTRITHSYYASTVIESCEKLKEEFIAEFYKDYPEGDVRWSLDKEVLVIDKSKTATNV